MYNFFLFTKQFFHCAKIAKSKQYHFALKTQHVMLDFSGFLRQTFHVTIDSIHLTLTKILFNFYSKLHQIIVNRLQSGFHAKNDALIGTNDYSVINFWMYVAQLSEISIFLIVYVLVFNKRLSTSL